MLFIEFKSILEKKISMLIKSKNYYSKTIYKTIHRVVFIGKKNLFAWENTQELQMYL